MDSVTVEDRGWYKLHGAQNHSVWTLQWPGINTALSTVTFLDYSAIGLRALRARSEGEHIFPVKSTLILDISEVTAEREAKHNKYI